jgi:nucleoside phosphorylase
MQLFLASTSLEFRGVLKHCSQVRRAPQRVVWARSALFQGKPVLLLANGAGEHRAYAALDAAKDAAKESNPKFVCNVGFCGALDPQLKIGDIVVSDSALQPRSPRPFRTGAFYCADHVVQTVREKSELHSAGFAAVDMESAGAARRARELGIPFYAVKAVSDLACKELRCDYNRALRDDGSISVMSLSLQAITRPLTCLPDLVRFGRNALRASECIGEFLAGCEF